MSEILLNLKGIDVVTKVYPSRTFKELISNRFEKKPYKKTLLQKINLSINTGDCLAIIGKNGSGKTTLAKLLCGIIGASDGTITRTVDSRYISDTSPEMDWNLSGRDNSKYFSSLLYPHLLGTPQFEKALNAAWEFSELGSDLDQEIRTYSLGMKKRLAFAVQTMFPADFMAIDEFSSNADVFFTKKMNQRLETHREAAKAQAWISHDADVLWKNCNRGIVVSAGSIVKSGTVEDCLNFYNDTNL